MGTYNVELVLFGIEADSAEDAVQKFTEFQSGLRANVTDDETGKYLGSYALVLNEECGSNWMGFVCNAGPDHSGDHVALNPAGTEIVAHWRRS